MTEYDNIQIMETRQVFLESADYYKIQLTKCRRTTNKLYNLIQFKYIPNLKPTDFKKTKEYTNKFDICFTNNKRKEINHIKMKELNIKNHWKGSKL